MMNFFTEIKPNVLSFFRSHRLAILSGVLVGTTYVPFPPWALLFCYLPLCFSALKNESLSFKNVFTQAWVTQFLLSLIGFHWVSYVAHEFGHLPWVVSVILLLLFATFIHLYIPLSLLLARYAQKKFQLSFVPSVFVFFSLLSLSEIFWPSLFAWNLGYTLYWANLPQAQLAEWIGFLGLSFMVYLSQGALAWLVDHFHRHKRLQRSAQIGVFVLVLAWIAMGFVGKRLQGHWQNPESQFKVSIIQANIGNDEKLRAEKGGAAAQQEIANTFFAMTRASLQQEPNPDFIMWPESAFPDFLNPEYSYRTYSRQFYAFSRSLNTPILTGAFSADPSTVRKRKEYNGLFLFGPNATILGEPYHKSHLLMFGEYFPLADRLEWLAKINPAGDGFGWGQGPSILPLEHNGRSIHIGAQICYESLDPQFSAELSQKGAHILANVTNDSWFGPRSEPYQHMIMTLARGIEVRRPMVRSTNTGISTVSLADGTILEKSPIGKAWSHTFTVPYFQNPPQTIYSRIARWLWLWPLFVGSFAIAISMRGKHRS